MNHFFLLRLLLGLVLMALAGCVPQALYFHESTKVAFSASYTASDSEPLATSFGYKRRIVAVVPGKERYSQSGKEADAENEEEALSTIAKFYVKAGTKEGLVIRNNFATGLAARKLLKEPTPAAVAVAGLMHGIPVPTDATGAVVNAEGDVVEGPNGSTMTVSDVAASRVARIRSKMVGGGSSGPSNPELKKPITKELFIRDGETWVRETFSDGRVVERRLKESGKTRQKPAEGEKTRKDDGSAKVPETPLPQDKLNEAASAELFIDPVTRKTMKRIKKADGTTEVVPLNP